MSKCLKWSVVGIFILNLLVACFPTSSDDETPAPDPSLVVSSMVGTSSKGVIDPFYSSTPTLSEPVSVSSETQVSSFTMVSSQIIISYRYAGADCYEEFGYQGGRGYNGGAMVSYDGMNYVAIYWAADDVIPPENDAFESEGACGYTPIYSNVMVSSVANASSETIDPNLVAGWLTEADYEAIFPYRDPFYTWESFKTAYENLQNIAGLGDFRNFLKEGTQEQKERELAAFFANVIQETGGGKYDNGLIYIEETCADSGNPEGRCLGYGSAAPNYYYGRGPMQLSWNYNYEAFSTSVYGNPTELLYDPDRVAEDPSLAWLAAMWFWNRVDGSYITPPPTIHDVMVNGASWQGNSGFGATIKIINGGIECPSSAVPNALRRIHFYSAVQTILGVTEDESNLHCM